MSPSVSRLIRATPAVMAALVVALTALSGPATAAYSSGNREWRPHPFAAQAQRLGLTSGESARLQTQVDREVRRTGGTQVAVNEVHYAGGNTVFVLPGETYARDLGATSGPGEGSSAARTAAGRGTMHRCPYHYFCTYTEPYFAGTMHELYHCTYYATDYFWFSWVNNQTTGTRAHFYNKEGDLHWITPEAYSEVDSMSAGRLVFSVKPC